MIPTNDIPYKWYTYIIIISRLKHILFIFYFAYLFYTSMQLRALVIRPSSFDIFLPYFYIYFLCSLGNA